MHQDHKMDQQGLALGRDRTTRVLLDDTAGTHVLPQSNNVQLQRICPLGNWDIIKRRRARHADPPSPARPPGAASSRSLAARVTAEFNVEKPGKVCLVNIIQGCRSAIV